MSDEQQEKKTGPAQPRPADRRRARGLAMHALYHRHSLRARITDIATTYMAQK